MMKCQTVMDMLERLAPKKMAEDWDNPGLLAGSPQQEVHKVMTCLDVSIPVVEAAIKESVDMIVAHHPMIFKGVRHLRTDLYDGKMFQMLLSHNIAVYAAHTNLDIAEGGVNDVLAQAVGLEKIESFVITDAEKGFSLGRIGYLPQAKSLDEFVMDVKKGLHISHVRIVRGSNKPVRKVALCSGAGAEFVSKAAFKGADVYLTGDVKYHEAQGAVQQGINLIDAGHFGTEFPVVQVLADYLTAEAAKMKKDLEVITDNISQDFFEFC